MAARDAEIAALKARDSPPLTGRQVILQDIAKALRGRIYNADRRLA